MNPVNLMMVERCLYEESWAIARRTVAAALAYEELPIQYPELFAWDKKVQPAAFTHVSMAVSHLHKHVFQPGIQIFGSPPDSLHYIRFCGNWLVETT